MQRDATSFVPRHNRVQRLRGRAAVEARAAYLHDHPLCVKCEQRGHVEEATEVDHVVPLCKGGSDTDSNKQALCAECHRVKTDADLGRTSRPAIGLDGYPSIKGAGSISAAVDVETVIAVVPSAATEQM
jgi:5-methylcytosine-specific restriction protein A